MFGIPFEHISIKLKIILFQTEMIKGFIGREQLEQFQKPTNGTNRTAPFIVRRNK